jgi:hypothetical protein
VVLTTHGHSSGFCVDPIEKKPLNHFLPGTSVLSFGTAGCNLACRFCQNWDISKSREVDTLADAASPAQIAQAASRLGCRSVAFTYNDPVIFMEYAIDVADACRERGLKAVAVTAGYVNAAPRAEFFRHMDAANVDLKAFSDDFYRGVCAGRLQPVLDTLQIPWPEPEYGPADLRGPRRRPAYPPPRVRWFGGNRDTDLAGPAGSHHRSVSWPTTLRRRKRAASSRMRAPSSRSTRTWSCWPARVFPP